MEEVKSEQDEQCVANGTLWHTCVCIVAGKGRSGFPLNVKVHVTVNSINVESIGIEMQWCILFSIVLSH